MNTKILSIIIPVYNVEKYLAKCFDSIIQQCTTDNIEIIIVNDGSPDNSLEIIAKYHKDYASLIKVVNQKNQGLSMARNNGLDIASGDYVWFVDSDDWLPENAIQNVLNYICNNSDVDVFSSYLTKYFEIDGKYDQPICKGKLYFTGLEYLSKKEPQGAAVRFVCKREFLNNNKLSFVKGLLHEDTIWGYMMLYKASKVMLIDKPIYVYRIRASESIMSSISIRSAISLIEGHRIVKEWMLQNVENNDRRMFTNLSFGLIKSLLDFCKNIVDTPDYKTFYKKNKHYIRKEAYTAWKCRPSDYTCLIISLSPSLFSFLCKKLLK